MIMTDMIGILLMIETGVCLKGFKGLSDSIWMSFWRMMDGWGVSGIGVV